jgi:hypothetical protein
MSFNIFREKERERERETERKNFDGKNRWQVIIIAVKRSRTWIRVYNTMEICRFAIDGTLETKTNVFRFHQDFRSDVGDDGVEKKRKPFAEKASACKHSASVYYARTRGCFRFNSSQNRNNHELRHIRNRSRAFTGAAGILLLPNRS